MQLDSVRSTGLLASAIIKDLRAGLVLVINGARDECLPNWIAATFFAAIANEMKRNETKRSSARVRARV